MSYSDTCPVCGHEHDFHTKRELESANAQWWKRAVSWVKRMSAQQSVERIRGYAGPSEHGTYPGHIEGCVCLLCETTPNR